MKEKTLKLSNTFFIPAIEYAIEANAILGIRNSGKTYTAMKVGEELMDAGIPLVVFDPIGVWKNLKVGLAKFKGYPIVVAGGDNTCDIVLTVDNAKEIMRAAMKENISIVFDYYSTALSHKATWIKITQEVVEVLLYENKDHGLRHIFIEEAAELIPQRLQPQHARVYAAIESLARMGRNAGLGMTIINQRAEEVNKAILEICAMSLLHKQVGKNSLLSISKWLEIRQVSNVSKMMKSLPQLQQGECWVVGNESVPVLIKIAPRKTYHPSPNKGITVASTGLLPMDVSKFVEKMNAILKPAEKFPIEPFTKLGKLLSKPVEIENYVTNIEEEISALRKRVIVSERREELYKRKMKDYEKGIIQLQKIYNGLGGAIDNIIPLLSDIPTVQPIAAKNFSSTLKQGIQKTFNSFNSTKSAPQQSEGMLSNKSGDMRMLQAAAMYHPNAITKIRMCAIAGMRPNSGSTGTYISTLKQKGFIIQDGKLFCITPEGLRQAGPVKLMPTGRELIDFWKSNIGANSGAGRMLEVLFPIYPHSLTKHDLSESIGMSAASGSFGTYLSTLKRNNLINVNGKEVCISPEIFQEGY